MINLHIVRNTVRNDSRVLKEAATLRDSGLFSKIEIVGLNEPGLPEHEVIDGLNVRRISLSSRGWSKGLIGQVFKFAEWRHRIVQIYGQQSLSVVHCHDLDPLPIGVQLKARSGARLVYDAHELETEQGERSKLRVALARWTERRLIGRADGCISVSQSICDWYAQTYPGVRPALVRNLPLRPSGPLAAVDLRARCGVPADALLFIYLGALSPGRGIAELMEAFADADQPHHIVFMGYGILANQIAAQAAQCSRIHLHPAVPPQEVIRHAAGADIGVSFIMDTCLSNRYCLPNKLFECALAGLPVLVSDLPEQRRFVERYDAGWCTALQVSALRATLRGLDRARCEALRAGLAERTAGLGWHQEAEVLLALYRDVLGRRPGAPLSGDL
ncbi:glycosyltransferase [Paucibacter sp. DJ1R-11]|uniref:glycosyltransferase n=1 Tax=Paucibacter sp. DJ1R-11 TaxID=2893556 RepID=UPI0021E49A0B|nr:glycosyltransferase [Paucibacter sp. DJ1R-11]MCV2364671.1 glycosyltransferase [Paucibacter sp. DJ1R-11]